MGDGDGMAEPEPLATVTEPAPALAPWESPPYDPEAT
jgi:hypothetical protein